MAASKIDLNPIFLNSNSIEFLTKTAAADAKHDFGTYFLRIFSDYNEGFKYKEIGTSIQLKDKTPLEEHPTLDQMIREEDRLKIHTADGKSWNPEIFPREPGGSGDYAYKSEEFSLNPVLSHNEPSYHKYLLETRKFSEPTFTALKVFDFINNNFGKTNNIYVQQDAGNLSLNDKFQSASNPGADATPYKFFYLNSREGLNDPASKTNGESPVVLNTVGRKIQVEMQPEKQVEKKDEDGKNVLTDRQIFYTRLPNSTLGRNASVTNNFNSIYNIEISPIFTDEEKTIGSKKVKKTQRVCMYLRDEKNVVIGSTNKGKKENAINTLYSILTTFLNKIKKKEKETAPYFQALQQKRGGDWLQCLATFDKERFGLTEKDTILLFTHDLICLSYALANGINVIFSVIDGQDQRILLFKNVTTAANKGLILYLDDIANLKKGVDSKKTELEADLRAYARSRKRLVRALEDKIAAANAEFTSKLAGLTDPAETHRTLREIVRLLIKAYFEYSFFTNMFPSEQIFISPYYQVTFAGDEPTVTPSELYTQNAAKFTQYSDYVLGLLKDFIAGRTLESIPVKYRGILTTLKTKPKESYTEKAEFYKGFTTAIEGKYLEEIDVKTAAGEEVEKTLTERMKELESFVSHLYNLEKRLASYKVIIKDGLAGVDVSKLTGLTKKIKSKDIDAISLFIDNFNPIPVNVKINARDEVEKTSRPKNRFAIFTNLTGGRTKKHELEQQNEKSEVDYSVFNYFIGNQLPDSMKTNIVTQLQLIVAKFDELRVSISNSTVITSEPIRERKIKDIEATKKLYEYFLNETKFHLNENTDWSYEMGLPTDILKKLDFLYVAPAVPNPPSNERDVFVGGASLVDEEAKPMVGGDVELTEDLKGKITEFLLTNFGDYFPEDNKLDSDFLEELRVQLSGGLMRASLEKELPKLLVPPREAIQAREYDDAIYNYIEFLSDDTKFDHIKGERTKLQVKQGIAKATDPDALKTIVKNTQIGKAVVTAASNAAEEAKNLAIREAAEAQAQAVAAKAKQESADYFPASDTSKIATEARAIVAKAEEAARAAVDAKANAETLWSAINTEKPALVLIADNVEGGTQTEIQAFGTPPPTDPTSFKGRVIALSAKAKQILENAKIVTEKKIEAELAIQEIETKKTKQKVFNFIGLLLRSDAATADAGAPTGTAATADAGAPTGTAATADAASGRAAAGNGAAPVAASPEIPTAFEEELNEIFEDYIKDETEIVKLAKKDDKSENVLLTTPATMYLDILMRYRDLYRTKFSPEENTRLDDADIPYDEKIDIFKTFLQTKFPTLEAEEAARSDLPSSGGARSGFLSINDVNIPYLGWITLYFYGRSLLNELQNTNHAHEGFDFPYLARQAQFYLSMEHSMYKHVLPKQKGGGGPGSPNRSTGSSVTTVTSETNTNAISQERARKQYNSSIQQRGDEIQQLMKTYAIGTQCDLFLTNILPRLDFMDGPEALQLKTAIFNAMKQGLSYAWIADFSANQNDFFFSESVDKSLNTEVDFKNTFLQRFLQDTLDILNASPAYEINDENKQAIEAKLSESLARMVEFLRNTEHETVKHMYQQVLISRLEEKIKNVKATRKIQRFNNQQKNKNNLTKEFNRIMSYTYANFCDLQFLIANRLVKEEGKRLGPGPLEMEFDTRLHSVILQSIPNGIQRFKQIEPKLQANAQLKQKYIQRIKNLNTYREAQNVEKYNSAFKSLQAFLQNPDNPRLLTGGTRRIKGKPLRLKSRRRTHKKR